MKIIELTKKHRKKAAVLLALCFLKDPLFRYFTKSVERENERKKVIEALLDSAMKIHLENGDPVYGVQKKKRIIGLISMQNLAKKVNPFRYLPVFGNLILKGVGIMVIIRVLKFAIKTRGFFPENTNYISHLDVHPKYQGKGLGTKLMDFIGKYSRNYFPKNKLSLSTNNKHNLSFYKKASYSVLGKKDFSFFRKHYLSFIPKKDI